MHARVCGHDSGTGLEAQRLLVDVWFGIRLGVTCGNEW